MITLHVYGSETATTSTLLINCHLSVTNFNITLFLTSKFCFEKQTTKIMNSSKRNICCICLIAPNQYIGLWEFDTESVKWISKLSYSVPEVVCVLPNCFLKKKNNPPILQEWLDHFLICMNCSDLIDKICAFKKLCLEADRLRKSLINKKKLSSVEDLSTHDFNIEHIQVAADAADNSNLEVNVKEEPCSSDAGPSETNVQESDSDPLMVVKVKVEDIETENTETEFENNEEPAKSSCSETEGNDVLVENKTDLELQNFDSDDLEEMKNDAGNVCNQCFLNYTVEEELVEHLHTTHESYTCEFCKDTFLGSINFINHVAGTHEKRTETFKIFKCFTCKHRFSSATDLYHHHSTHSYNCELCRKRFKTKGALNVHKKHKHFSAEAKSDECAYFCKTCETHFSSLASLKLHNTSKHRDPETWKHTCKVCNRKFPAKQNYTIHMRRHLGVKPYPCQLCSKSYVSNDDLNKHINAHKNGHPGKCFYCGGEYKEKREMRQHIMIVHEVKIQPAGANRVKNRICNVCNKGFYDNNQLAKHIRTHTGEKPYECCECGKAFSDSANLGHHLQRMHNRIGKTKI